MRGPGAGPDVPPPLLEEGLGHHEVLLGDLEEEVGVVPVEAEGALVDLRLLLDDDEGFVLVHLALLTAPLLLLVARRRGLLTIGLVLEAELTSVTDASSRNRSW